MLKHGTLTSRQWQRIEQLLPGRETNPGRTGDDNRAFVNAVVSTLRANAKWHKLPEDYGKWKSVHKRFVRLAENRVWEKVFEVLVADVRNKFVPRDEALLQAYRASEAAGRDAPRSKWWRTPNKHGHLGPSVRGWRGPMSLGEMHSVALDLIEQSSGSKRSNEDGGKRKRGRPRPLMSAEQIQKSDAMINKLLAQRWVRSLSGMSSFAQTVEKTCSGITCWTGVDGVIIDFDNAHHVRRICSKVAQPVTIDDRCGIHTATVSAEKKAKANIVRVLQQDVVSGRVITDVDATLSQSIQEAGSAGEEIWISTTDQRNLVQGLADFIGSVSSGTLQYVAFLQKGYDPEAKEAWVVAGISDKIVGRDMRTRT